MPSAFALLADFQEPPPRELRHRNKGLLRSSLLTVVAGLAAAGLLFAGATTLGRERTVVSHGAMGEVTLLEENACDLYPYLKFEVPSAVVYNNLGNKGPDSGRGEGIVYKTVDLGRGAGKELDREVYLTVNATSTDYEAFSPRLNGVQGKYGSVNLMSGSRVDLLLSFFDRATMKPLVMEEFALTFFDLDTGNDGTSEEYVTVGGFKSYHLTESTEVQVSRQSDGRTRFMGSTMGTGQDNPKDPMFLTPQQKNRAVTLLFGKTDNLSLSLGATKGSGPRFFTFVGRPSLLCAVTVQQDFKPPLPDLAFSPPTQAAVMAGERETFAGFAVKEGQRVAKEAVVARTRKGGSILEYRAPFAGTVVRLQSALKEGEDLDQRLSEKTLAVVERPSLPPLQRGAGIVEAGPGENSDISSQAVFERYLVKKGDRVFEGDAIAALRSDGREMRVRSKGYGVVKELQAMEQGMLLKSVEDRNLATLAPFPALGPLSAENVAAAPLEEKAKLAFDFYAVVVGDVVKAGDRVAMLQDSEGRERPVRATHGGVVTSLQELKAGTPLSRVADGNLITAGKFPALPVASGEAAARARLVDGVTFLRYSAEAGELVGTGDTVAEVSLPGGKLLNVTAPRPGVVLRRQEGLRQGMPLKGVLVDGAVATLGHLPKLYVANGEIGAFAPPSLRFKEWRVAQGDAVERGDAVAIFTTQDGDERQVVAGRTGVVTKLLSQLSKGDKIGAASEDGDVATVGDAPVNFPAWLMLFVPLLLLMCCLAGIFMGRRRREYKPMDPAPPSPKVMAREMTPVAREATPRENTTVSREGMRLEFVDEEGAEHTVFAAYKPLGIKHHDAAPIVVQDFTVNSYAKNGLGVKPGWRLTHVAGEDYRDCGDFAKVSERLAAESERLPFWPLPLEFRKAPGDTATHVYNFGERPLGMEFTNVAPIKISRIYKGSPAEKKAVEVGWYLTRIGDFDVHENQDFRQVLKYLKEGVQGLPEDGQGAAQALEAASG